MTQALQDAQAAYQAGDSAQARQLVKQVLKNAPSADAWVLAAKVMDDDAKAITCLKKALALDEWHMEANRLLLKLEDVKPLSEIERQENARLRAQQAKDTAEVFPPLPEFKREGKLLPYQLREQRQRRWRRIGCISLFILQTACGIISVSLIGLLPGVIGTLTQVLGGPPPITEVEGTPIEQVEDAPAVVAPSSSQRAAGRDVDVLDHGYNHEYTFDATQGEVYVGYVQFMSVSASAVAENVRIIDPSGRTASEAVCPFLDEQGLLGGQGNVTFECSINQSGLWRVRILGVQGESTGAYFVGVEKLG